MSRPSRVPENLAVLNITLGENELSSLDDAFGAGVIRGERYPHIDYQEERTMVGLTIAYAKRIDVIRFPDRQLEP